MLASEVSPEFKFGVQPSGSTDSAQVKAWTPCLLRRSAQSSSLEFSLQAALIRRRLSLNSEPACSPPA